MPFSGLEIYLMGGCISVLFMAVISWMDTSDDLAEVWLILLVMGVLFVFSWSGTLFLLGFVLHEAGITDRISDFLLMDIKPKKKEAEDA